MAALVTVNDLLDGHVVLDVQCLDWIYLNGYVPSLQVGGQLVSFMKAHLGDPIPPPAILEKIGTRFRQDVRQFAEEHHIPVIKFSKGDRKIDVMAPHLARQAATGRSEVAAIGVAQEFQNVLAACQRPNSNGAPWYTFNKADRRVTCSYFYLWDSDFGPSFIKICAYFPYPIKVWVNGHEWAKRQASVAGIGFTALSNGFATCDDPEGLREICDRLGPGTIGVLFERWMSVLPIPLIEHDHTDGYWRELSMRQVEVSRTLVFDAPRRAGSFFEALVADSLDIGRPDTVELIFARPPKRTGRPVELGCTPKTSLITRGTDITVNAFFKHSRVKQYLKDGRAFRIETNALRSSTPKSTTGSYDHYSPRTDPPHRRNYEPPFGPSTNKSAATSTTPAWERPPENSRSTSKNREPRSASGEVRDATVVGISPSRSNARTRAWCRVPVEFGTATDRTWPQGQCRSPPRWPADRPLDRVGSQSPSPSTHQVTIRRAGTPVRAWC